MTSDPLATTVAAHKAGRPVGLTSVCSAHPLVLRACLREAAETGGVLLVEATSNQVDQFGGYTGMRPADFAAFVRGLASEAGFPLERLVLGGDHLGPNTWQHEEPGPAMQKAEDLVDAFVSAGYAKIHLDCSMPLAGEVAPLSDAVVAGRAARLLVVAERAAARAGRPGTVRYVIGTEVPVPGGAHETIDHLAPTSAEAARATLAAHRRAFEEVGLLDVWPRVVALVVQPGVEFDHVRVVDYLPSETVDLQGVLRDEPTMVFEAHSTDYQLPEALASLVRDHWAVLKVGPGLTFALREGLFALAAIEEQLVEEEARSQLLNVVGGVMLANPQRWEHYYEGDAVERRIARRFSYSDRMRYYLPDAQISAAVERLLANLDRVGIPEPLISQYLPEQYWRHRRGQVGGSATDLLLDRVRDALRPYSTATTGQDEGARPTAGALSG